MMFIAALCPTYRRPALVANTLWLWQQQSYPAGERRLIIYDDGGSFAGDQRGDNWMLIARDRRSPTLASKYPAMLAALPRRPDAVAIWDDDDAYLPGYLSAHAACLASGAAVSHPSHVLSDYTGQIIEEPTADRFWAAMVLKTEIIERGGWPRTPRIDFDSQCLAEFTRRAGGPRTPTWGVGGPHQFIFRWHTGEAHAQTSGSSPGDLGWYARHGELAAMRQPPVILAARQDSTIIPLLTEYGNKWSGKAAAKL